MPESVKQEDSKDLTTEDEQTVLLTWNPKGRHKIQVIGITKPSQLRHLLEFGLRHIRACIYRGKPITSVAQVSQQKKELTDVNPS